MAGLGLNGHSLPPVWTVDLVRGVAAGGDEAAGQWQVLKLDCSCVGIAAAQQLAAPLADAAVSHCLCLVFPLTAKPSPRVSQCWDCRDCRDVPAQQSD